MKNTDFNTLIRKAIAAGFMICMGCVVYLRLLPISKVAAAVCFSAGLWFVVSNNAMLFTGKVASPDYSIIQKVLMLVFNVVGAAVCGILASLTQPDLAHQATAILPVSSGILTLLWKSVMCGVCMYLATRPSQSRLPHVVYGVTLFILSGYAHSIAVAGYAAIALQPSALPVILLIAVGNGIGSYLIRFLISEQKSGKM